MRSDDEPGLVERDTVQKGCCRGKNPDICTYYRCSNGRHLIGTDSHNDVQRRARRREGKTEEAERRRKERRETWLLLISPNYLLVITFGCAVVRWGSKGRQGRLNQISARDALVLVWSIVDAPVAWGKGGSAEKGKVAFGHVSHVCESTTISEAPPWRKKHDATSPLLSVYLCSRRRALLARPSMVKKEGQRKNGRFTPSQETSNVGSCETRLLPNMRAQAILSCRIRPFQPMPRHNTQHHHRSLVRLHVSVSASPSPGSEFKSDISIACSPKWIHVP